MWFIILWSFFCFVCLSAGISFTPHETGEHLVNVFRNKNHIANSPFKILVGEGEIGNASKVKVSGKGLVEGMANELNEFNVNTKDAGAYENKSLMLYTHFAICAAQNLFALQN